jgi:hypothetical protein
MAKYEFQINYPEQDNLYYTNMVQALPGKDVYRKDSNAIPAVTNPEVVTVSGLTDPGATVSIYNNNKFQGDTVADSTGYFEMNISLVYDPENSDYNNITGTSKLGPTTTPMKDLLVQVANTHLILSVYANEFDYGDRLEEMVKNDNFLYVEFTETLTRGDKVYDTFPYRSNKYLQGEVELVNLHFQVYRVFDYPVLKYDAIYINAEDKTSSFITNPLIYYETLTPDEEFLVYSARYTNWLGSIPPVVYKNGVLVPASNYVVDYTSGLILFSTPNNQFDIITCTYQVNGAKEGLIQYSLISTSTNEELLPTAGQKIYSSKNTGWISVLEVKKNDTVITTGFSIDYILGKLIFDSPLLPTDKVTVTYEYRRKISGTVTVDYIAETIMEIVKVVDTEWSVLHQDPYAAVDPTYKVYEFSKAYWNENYLPTIYRNGEAVDPSFYTINYIEGTVTFNLSQKPTDEIKATYGFYYKPFLPGLDYELKDDKLYWLHLTTPEEEDILIQYGDGSRYGYEHRYGPPRAKPREGEQYIVTYRVSGARTKQILENNIGKEYIFPSTQEQRVEDYRRILRSVSIIFRFGATIFSIKEAVKLFTGLYPTIVEEFDTAYLGHDTTTPPPPIDPSTWPWGSYIWDDGYPIPAPFLEPGLGFFVWSDVVLTFGFFILVYSRNWLTLSEKESIEGLIERIKPAHTKAYILYYKI